MHTKENRVWNWKSAQSVAETAVSASALLIFQNAILYAAIPAALLCRVTRKAALQIAGIQLRERSEREVYGNEIYMLCRL